jgi:hypothetical protein
MSSTWAASLPREEIAALKTLRRGPRLEVCDADSLVWLRGDRADERLDRRLRMIPGGRRFAVQGDGQLRPVESHVPVGHLPRGPWTPLAEWLDVDLPTAAWPGESTDRVPFRLERSAMSEDASVEPTLLVTSLSAWTAYGRTAPQVRLDRWTFAADRQVRVIVRGLPLPPLRGERFIERGGVAVPVGWRWTPEVDPQVVRDLLCRETPHMQPNDLALLFPDGSWEHLASESFVKADRSAIRLTAESIA